MKDMFPERSEVVTLYEQMLNLAGKEEHAVRAADLEELEACLRRKEEIVEKLHAAASRQGENILPQGQAAMNTLIEKVVEAHESVRNDIKEMLDECRRAILGVRAGHQAHMAYQRSRRRDRERSAKVL